MRIPLYVIIQLMPGGEWVVEPFPDLRHPKGYRIQLPASSVLADDREMMCAIAAIEVAHDFAHRVGIRRRGMVEPISLGPTPRKEDAYYLVRFPGARIVGQAEFTVRPLEHLQRLAIKDPSAYTDGARVLDRAIGLFLGRKRG